MKSLLYQYTCCRCGVNITSQDPDIKDWSKIVFQWNTGNLSIGSLYSKGAAVYQPDPDYLCTECSATFKEWFYQQNQPLSN